jgi:NAD(P)H-quinone oxidoreductase subunit 6
MDIRHAIFFAISALTVASAAVVAFSRNIIYAAFALLGVFAGVLGLYIMLSADFVAIVQLVIYIGGILILILFAVMLTTKIGEVKISNRAMAPVPAFIIVASLGVLIWKIYMGAGWVTTGAEEFNPTTAAIGDKLLGAYLLPFEIISLLLVLVMVGAVVIARREVK